MIYIWQVVFDLDINFMVLSVWPLNNVLLIYMNMQILLVYKQVLFCEEWNCFKHNFDYMKIIMFSIIVPILEVFCFWDKRWQKLLKSDTVFSVKTNPRLRNYKMSGSLQWVTVEREVKKIHRYFQYIKYITKLNSLA